MQQQPINEIQQLLQQKIFGHPCIEDFNPYSRAVLKRLHLCHTAGIGVHHLRCNKTSCNNEHYQYHCCGNRHCPNCGGMKKEQWLQDRMSELLPTTYYHLVFTLPQELRSLVMGNRTIFFNLLFDAAHYTINLLGADRKWLGAKPGVVSILHTNGQDLSFHTLPAEAFIWIHPFNCCECRPCLPKLLFGCIILFAAKAGAHTLCR